MNIKRIIIHVAKFWTELYYVYARYRVKRVVVVEWVVAGGKGNEQTTCCAPRYTQHIIGVHLSYSYVKRNMKKKPVKYTDRRYFLALIKILKKYREE